MSETVFYDRAEAGRLLAERLKSFRDQRPLVIGLPRGGVAVAHEVAKALGARLDIVIVRKIGAPGNPEYGIGAIAEDGSYQIDEAAAQTVGATGPVRSRALERARSEIRERVETLRKDRPAPHVKSQTVIVVDDGLATGVTALAACRYLKAQGARRVILAVPVAAAETVERLRGEVDELVYVSIPRHFQSVGQWYYIFDQLTDHDVTDLLENKMKTREIHIQSDGVELDGTLSIPPNPLGTVIFAHGSGSSRKSPRNIQVAQALNETGLATLLFDLLTPVEATDRGNVFDIPLLGERLIIATEWLQDNEPRLKDLPLGYFGASTGAAAALQAAAELGDEVAAVVSRGGRPDLAGTSTQLVSAPTLLLVGSLDDVVIDLNREVLPSLPHGELVIIPGATHLFEEPGTLEKVAEQARDWFTTHFRSRAKDHAAA